MKGRIRRILVKLIRLNNTPAEIALGVSIGIFIAILPVYGLHTLLLLLFAVIIRRANKIAMLVGTNISLPPTVPFITWGGYEIGRFLLGSGQGPLTWDYFRNISFQKAVDIYPALFLGSFILGIVTALAFYAPVYFIVKAIRRKRKNACEAGHKDKKV